ncbi:MAG: class I SAM-dependent methyltransferase [Demequina sp.]|uniref:class I SAM-dependent methyltransferase n=1 Tax=Demequina sp. TaxID=2050685 RepID=UPI0019B7A2D1|nr:class I SAM-dependent methyltransferase [Demequina sp.]MBC7299305.1 class I SAM-dependent methyltransferase [Demequina sp.]
MKRDGTRFGEATEAYGQGRPGYPAAAVTWMLGDGPLTVLDLGAGTGKLTVQVVAQGHHAVAVDPDASMLAVLNEALPDIDARIGTAEEIPLPDASVDAVVCGQAWHWVDVAAASREVSRVLRPGGTLGLVWNVRDESVPWVAALTQAMHASVAEKLIADGGPSVGAPFTSLQSRVFAWTSPRSRAALVSMVHSRSYYIAADADGRASIDARVDEVLAGVPTLDSGGTVDLPYLTHAYRSVAP